MAWLYLLLAGCLELGFTTCFKLSANFTNWRWTIAFLVCATLSVYCFNQAIKSIPLGTAYVVWTGIGAAWRNLPTCLPPRPAGYNHLVRGQA